MIVNIVGLLGVFALAVCAVPQSLQSLKQRHSHGVNTFFLTLWFFGELLTALYVLFTTCDVLLLSNYVFNLALLSVIIYYKIFPKQ